MLTLKVPDGYAIDRTVCIQDGLDKALLQALHDAWSSSHRIKGFYFVTDQRVDPICGVEWPHGSGKFYETLPVEAITSLSWILPGRAEFICKGGAHTPHFMVENYNYDHGKGTVHILKRVLEVPLGATLQPGTTATITLNKSVPLKDLEASVEALGYKVRFVDGYVKSGRPSSRGRGCHVAKVVPSADPVFVAHSIAQWAPMHPDIEAIPAGTPIDVTIV